MNTKTSVKEKSSQAGEAPPTVSQLKRQILELQEKYKKLSSQLMVFKQEKQKEKQDSPRTPLQTKEKIKEKNHYNNSKMDSGKDTENNSQKGRKEAFIPPTLEEVRAYMNEIGENGFTAERFWNYYEAKGWVLGKVKMRFWKRVLDNWSNKENEKAKRRRGATSPVQQNIVTFNAYKPVNTTGAVSRAEYERMVKEGKSLTPPLSKGEGGKSIQA